MRERIDYALKKSKADYTEIRIEEREATTVAFRGKNLEIVSAVIDSGGIVRCLCRDGGWGISTFNSRDNLLNKVEQAYNCAKVVKSDEPIELSPIPLSVDSTTVNMDDDFRCKSLAQKKSLVEEYNNILLNYDTKIVDTQSRYSDLFCRVFFANSEGSFIEEERPMIAISAIAIARDGDNVQRASYSRSKQGGFEAVQGYEKSFQHTAKRSLDLLNAQTVVGGQYTVILNQELAGVFIHEAFGHLSEADFVYENPKAQEMMQLGRRFGSDILNVYDDGSLPGLRGTHKYDDEGTLTSRTDLIKDGILTGRLHSRETAAKLGEKTTGNARATSYRYPPIVRMTNTAIDDGETLFQDMISDIKLGIYACDAYGGQTMLENFSFSSAYAYMIRNGKIAEMVKDVILSGNLFTTLMNIDAIGNDFEWSQKSGGCGKGQGGLPVTTGSPHIRIQNVVIGGK